MSAEPDAVLYYKRALHLRCPECGESPIFTPLSQTRTVNQWMHPVEGCPRCNYKYEREPGYFLLSTWALNYGLVGGLGLMAALIVEWTWHPPFWQTMLCVAIPVIISNVLFVRHSKALFIAFDHIMDPQYQLIERQQNGGILKT
ncbi:MAG: DUF983 domain-containing protein [Planctomycetota bacterium]